MTHPKPPKEDECLCYLAWGEIHSDCPIHSLKAMLKKERLKE